MLRPLVLALAISLSPAILPAQAPARPAAQTLYARLGGFDFLARLVDTAFPRVASNPQLKRLFQGHAVDSQIRQRQLIIEALCHATGGPCAYIGRELRTVHVGLGITDADWRIFMGIIGGALAELQTPPAARDELLALFETSLRPTVVIPE